MTGIGTGGVPQCPVSDSLGTKRIRRVEGRIHAPSAGTGPCCNGRQKPVASAVPSPEASLLYVECRATWLDLGNLGHNL